MGVGVLTHQNTLILVDSFAVNRASHQIIESARDVETSLNDAESAQREYVITGERAYLVPYIAKIQHVTDSLDAFGRLVQGNPRQEELYAKLQPVVVTRIANLNRSMELRQTRGFDAALEDFLRDSGEGLMRTISQLTWQMQDTEQAFLTQRENRLTSRVQITIVVFVIGSFISFLLLFIVFSLLTQEIAGREVAEKALQRAYHDLDNRIRERTAELASTNEVLLEEIVDRKRAEQELRLLQSITLKMAEAEDVDTALGLVLQNVCETTGWVLGQAWVSHPNGNLLICSPSAYSHSPAFQKFVEFSHDCSFTSGVGLPGKVWAQKTPVWVSDVAADADFIRSAYATEVGLKSGVGIPVLEGDAVVAVLEFFLDVVREEDDRLVNVITTVAAQVGTLIQRKRAEQSLRESRRLLQSTMDALSAHVAILDRDGNILSVNAAWREFADANHYGGANYGVGLNYLKFCESLPGAAGDDVQKVADGLRAIMQGKAKELRLDYPCHSPTEQRWFQLYASRFGDGNEMYLVLAHENVTEIKTTQELLRRLSSHLLYMQDEERRRIARELHDTTAQKLSAVMLNCALLQQQLTPADEKEQKTIDDTLRLVEQSLREIRTLSYLLHPPLLDEAGLVSALRWYVEGFSKRSGIHVDLVTLPELERLPLETETALFRVVQESLTNIHRHSGSHTATIQISQNASTITLEVKDAGKGIIEESLSTNGSDVVVPGVGIMGMRERLRQLGGMLEVSSSKHGTTVKAALPLGRNSQ